MNKSLASENSAASGARIPSIVDLAPTILNYLGVPVPQTMEGTSIL